MAEICETVMLICFGASWPVSAYKSWKSRKTGGKSLLFLYLILFGYIVGIVGKILYRPSYVIAVYAFNLLMVSLDMAFYYRNRRLEKRAEQEKERVGE